MRTRIGVYGLLAFVSLAVLTYLYSSIGVTERNCLRIEMGMTKNEVATLFFGLGPDDSWAICGNTIFHENWQGRVGVAMVAYDVQGLVIWRAWDETRPRRTYFQKFQTWVFGEVRE